MSTRITLSLPDELYSYLKQTAAQQHRSIASLCIHLIHAAVIASHQPAPPSPKPLGAGVTTTQQMPSAALDIESARAESYGSDGKYKPWNPVASS